MPSQPLASGLLPTIANAAADSSGAPAARRVRGPRKAWVLARLFARVVGIAFRTRGNSAPRHAGALAPARRDAEHAVDDADPQAPAHLDGAEVRVRVRPLFLGPVRARLAFSGLRPLHRARARARRSARPPARAQHRHRRHHPSLPAQVRTLLRVGRAQPPRGAVARRSSRHRAARAAAWHRTVHLQRRRAAPAVRGPAGALPPRLRGIRRVDPDGGHRLQRGEGAAATGRGRRRPVAEP